MAKFTLKGNKVIGTKKKDKITWIGSKLWKKVLTVKAGAGNDVINFKKSKYKSILYGGKGNDKILGGKKADKIFGNAGNDKLYGYNGSDTIKAGAGNDYIDGGAGADIIYGESGTNTLKGGAGNDKIYGGTGVDTFVFAKNFGIDYLYNTNKNDILKFDGINFSDLAFTKNSNDLIISTGSGRVNISGFYSSNKIDVIISKDGIHSLSNDAVIGINGSGTIAGADNDEIINGSSGADTIYGYGGDDVIYTGSGADSINGGNGNNTIIINGAGDKNISTSINAKDTIEIASNVSPLGDIIIDYEGARTYSYNGDTSKLLNKYGNDLIINYTDEDYLKIKDYFSNVEEYGSKIKIKDNNDVVSIIDLTKLQGGSYQIPVNIYYSTGAENENIEVLADANNNVYSNPDQKNNVIFTSENTSANATYNVNLYGGGQIDTYGDMDYNFSLYNESTVNFGSGTIQTTLNLQENSCTTLNCNDSSTITVYADDNYSAQLDINTYQNGDTKTNTTFIKENGSNDLKILNTYQTNESTIILKDYFSANGGNGYQFGIHSENIDVLSGGSTNPLSELGITLTGTNNTYTANTIYNETVDVSSENWSHTFYNYAVNGVAGNDLFKGGKKIDTYYCDVPISGLTTIWDNTYELILSSGSNVFFEVNNKNFGAFYLTKDTISSLTANPENGIRIRTDHYSDIHTSNYKLNTGAIDAVKSMVNGWLSENGYSSTTEAFQNAAADGKDITQMLAYYSNINWQSL